MANWTDLSSAFGYGTKLTSQQMQQLRDNITALAEGASGAPEIDGGNIVFEELGNNNYYKSWHNFGGNEIDAQHTGTYATDVTARCCLKGSYRFYWGYRQQYNNITGFWRVLKNGVLVAGPVSDGGTSEQDPIHWRTDDIDLEAGDVLEWQSYEDSVVGTCETYIYLRGLTRQGYFDFNTHFDYS